MRTPEQRDTPRLWAVGPVPLVALALLIPGHMFGWALEWVWLALQLLLGALVLVGNQRRLGEAAGIPALAWACVFAGITVIGCLSAFHGHANLGLPLADGDLVDLVRLLLFIPLVLHLSATLDRHHVDSIVRLLKLCVVLNVGCAAVLVFDVQPLAKLVLMVYEDAKVQYAIHHIRIGIPFANPNFAALLFSLMLAIFLFFRRSAPFAMLTILAIFLTGSRSGYLAIAPLLLLAYVVLSIHAFTSWRGILTFVAVHAVALAVISAAGDLFGDFSRMAELVTAIQGGDLGRVDTASIRFELIENAKRFIETSPLLGVGPGRALGLDIVDSQIFAWPLNYGIPAAVLLYGIFVAPMVVLCHRADRLVHKAAAIATALSFFLMLGTGDFMKNFRLYYLAILMMHVMHLVAVTRRPVPIAAAAQPA